METNFQINVNRELPKQKGGMILIHMLRGKCFFLQKGTLNIKFDGGVSLNHNEKMKKLLREYGYPEEAIPRIMQEISSMSYDRVKKLILPYNDITADKN